MKYLWTDGVSKPTFEKLTGSIKTDVLIIGGGMAGILCAKALQDTGIDYVLVEGREIGNGITKGTTAVITAQHDLLYSDLMDKYGKKKAKMYLDANLSAVSRFKEHAKTIECDFEILPSVMYSVSDGEKMQKEAKAVKSLGFDAEYITDVPLPVKIKGGVRYPDMAQFHPLRFLYGLAEGLNVFENTYVTKLEGTTAFTHNGTIRAKKIIVATHFPFINKSGFYFVKMYQKRLFVLVVERPAAEKLGCNLVEHSGEGMFFRDYGNLLIFGGGERKTGKQKGGFLPVRQFANTHYKNYPERYFWANQDCITLDDIPYIGVYGRTLPNVYVATGFNEWGMTSSMIASIILSNMISGKRTAFEEVFNPSRSVLKPRLFSNLGSTVINLATPTPKRCAHLGCALKQNHDEGTWDCPCHGSRFDKKGRIIDNPAMKDAKVK